MAQPTTLRERIVSAALDIGERGTWEQVTLRGIADELGVSLDQIRSEFAQKDDIVEAWFDRADAAMLRAADDCSHLSRDERIHAVFMSWLDALAPHRRLTGEMLLYKFEFGHVHLQALGIMRISRTVQWFREAARLDATHLHRAVEEAALTSTYLLTFGRWLNDRSADSALTREFLRRLLRAGKPMMRVSEAFLQPGRTQSDTE